MVPQLGLEPKPDRLRVCDTTIILLRYIVLAPLLAQQTTLCLLSTWEWVIIQITCGHRLGIYEVG